MSIDWNMDDDGIEFAMIRNNRYSIRRINNRTVRLYFNNNATEYTSTSVESLKNLVRELTFHASGQRARGSVRAN